MEGGEKAEKLAILQFFSKKPSFQTPFSLPNIFLRKPVDRLPRIELGSKKRKTMEIFERILIVNCLIGYGRRENVSKCVFLSKNFALNLTRISP